MERKTTSVVDNGPNVANIHRRAPTIISTYAHAPTHHLDVTVVFPLLYYFIYPPALISFFFFLLMLFQNYVIISCDFLPVDSFQLP